MKILRLTQVPPQESLNKKGSVTQFGLLTTHLFPLSNALAENNIQSYFFSGGASHSLSRENVNGFLVARTRLPSKPLFLPYGWALQNDWKKLCDEWGKIDIIHAHNPHYAYGIVSLVKKKKIPLVITIHGSFHYNEWEKPLLKHVFDAASAIIAINEPSRVEAIELGASPEKIALIHTGINARIFFPRKVTKKDRMLFVGRLVAWKKVDVLLKAFASLPKHYRAWSLDIVGSGPEEEKLRTLTKELGVENRVVFHGEQTQEKLAELYSSSRISVFPHEYDSFGKTVIESLACGTPIVATDHDIPPSIRAGGWFYPHHLASQPSVLAETLVRALQSKQLAKRGRDGLKVTRREFTWERVAEQNEKVYQRVLN